MSESKSKEGTETKQEYRARFKDARDRFIAEVESMSEAELEEPVVDQFSAKDLMAHILEWDYSAMYNSRLFLAGEEPDLTPDYDNDLFNGVAVSIWRDKPGSVVLAQLKKSTQEVMDYIDSLTEKELFRDRGVRFIDDTGVKWVVNPSWFLGETEHDIGHAEQIADWKTRRAV